MLFVTFCSNRIRLTIGLLLALGIARAAGPAPSHLPGTELMKPESGLAQRNASQWDAFLLAQIETARLQRAQAWRRDVSSAVAYAASVRPNRERLAQAVGCVDPRVKAPRIEWVTTLADPGPLAETADYAVWRARWPALDGVTGEGLVLRPKTARTGLVVLLPDADQTPETWAGFAPANSTASGLAHTLASSGVEVVILALVSRANDFSGDETTGVTTNQPHREWIYRQAAPVGRHIIGYEVQKVRAVIDALAPAVTGPADANKKIPVGVMGYGEGGLIALYVGALDERVQATWVSGYFQPRERVWAEPLYRNVWGLLAEFGDADIASLIAPRGLVIEACDGPNVVPPAARATGGSVGRSASEGSLQPVAVDTIQAEWSRARAYVGETAAAHFNLIVPDAAPGSPGSPAALKAFARELGVTVVDSPHPPPALTRALPADYYAARQQRAVRELSDHAQAIARLSDRTRDTFFWSKLKPGAPEDWRAQTAPLRRYFADEFIGRISIPDTPPRVRSVRLPEMSTSQISVYEVVFDVVPGVQDWGLLLLPADLQNSDRRPVVVCQHGANSEPADLIEGPAVEGNRYSVYQSYAARLASRGFVVFAPSMPNSTGGELFRQLQRKANPMRKSIFSLVVASQTRLLQWLKAQPFVDPARIAYYGMSYGGKAAMRVPVVIEDFAASVVSGDFNDYVKKMTSIRSDRSGTIFNASPEMIEFNLANTFSYAEMAALIAPRPFMVEHGYLDRVAPTEWMTAEYAKVQRLYFRLGIPERTSIFHFDGPHTVMGTETFAFLHRVLNWPVPATP